MPSKRKCQPMARRRASRKKTLQLHFCWAVATRSASIRPPSMAKAKLVMSVPRMQFSGVVEDDTGQIRAERWRQFRAVNEKRCGEGVGFGGSRGDCTGAGDARGGAAGARVEHVTVFFAVGFEALVGRGRSAEGGIAQVNGGDSLIRFVRMADGDGPAAVAVGRGAHSHHAAAAAVEQGV